MLQSVASVDTGSTNAFLLTKIYRGLPLRPFSLVCEWFYVFGTAISAAAGSLLDVVGPTTGRDWLANVNNIYGGAAKFGTLFGMSAFLRFFARHETGT